MADLQLPVTIGQTTRERLPHTVEAARTILERQSVAVAASKAQAIGELRAAEATVGDPGAAREPAVEPAGRAIAHHGAAPFIEAPESHEPDLGELHHPYLFKVIDELGWTGHIGCEYRPRGRTSAGLGWLRSALQATPGDTP